MSAIVMIYVRLIREGRRTLDSVPETIRTEVQQALENEDEGSA